MEPDGLETFIDDVGRVVSSTDDEHEISKRVAKRLSQLLAGGYRLPLEVRRPSPVHHVTYPLYIAPDDSWSMASVVWDVGQRTPVPHLNPVEIDRRTSPKRMSCPASGATYLRQEAPLDQRIGHAHKCTHAYT